MSKVCVIGQENCFPKAWPNRYGGDRILETNSNMLLGSFTSYGPDYAKNSEKNWNKDFFQDGNGKIGNDGIVIPANSAPIPDNYKKDPIIQAKKSMWNSIFNKPENKELNHTVYYSRYKLTVWIFKRVN